MKRRRLILVLGLLGPLPAPARAQDSEQLSSNSVKVYTVLGYVATLKSYCDVSVPASKVSNIAALDGWKKVDNISQIENLTVKFAEKVPATQANLASIRSKMLEKIRQSAAGREAKFCGQLPELLKDPATRRTR